MANLFNQLGLFGVSAASQLPQPIQPAKLGLLDRLGQRLVPSDSQWQPTDAERKAMVKRGLLEAGLTMLATPTGAGNSPVMGIARGLLAGQQGIRADAEDMRSKALGLGSSNSAIPVKIQEAQWFAKQQGLNPGDPGYADFIRRYSGASGNYTFIDDPATGKRYRQNSKTGEMEAVDASGNPDTSTDSAKLTPEQISATARRMYEGGYPLEKVNAWFDKQVAAYNLANGMGNSPDAPPSRIVTDRPAGGYVGMSAAEKAAAEADAKNSSELRFAGPISTATAEGKAKVEAQYAPQIAGATTAAQEAAKNASAVGAKAEQRTRDAKDILTVLDEVEKILPQATGGYGGYAADAALGGAGYATKGSKANAQLEVLSSELIRRVPRFEGPQSDADRKAYMVAAGDVANPLKPVAVRVAAVKTMRKLQEQYARGGANKSGGKKVGRFVIEEN